jgi:CHAT domain-containing protein
MSPYRITLGFCLSAILLAACQTDNKPAVSLSQAVKTTAKFESQTFTPPPRKIEDVRKMLEAASDRTPEAMARLKATAAAPAGKGASAEERARSLYGRAIAAGELGRNRQMRDDLAAALAQNPGDSVFKSSVLLSSGAAQADGGNILRGIEFQEKGVALLENLGSKKIRIAANRAAIARLKVSVGDLDGAARYLDRSRALLDRMESGSRAPRDLLAIPQATLLRAESLIAAKSGRYGEAEAKARAALTLIEKLIADKVQPRSDLPVYPMETTLKLNKINTLGGLARALARQDRLAEAEIAAREAIAIAAAAFGRNSIYMARALDPMVLVLSRTGRLPEARKLAQIAIDILEQLGVDQDGYRLNQARHRLGGVFVANGDWDHALASFARIAKGANGDDVLLNRFYRYDLDRATALLQSERIGEAAQITGPAAQRMISKLGPKNYEAAQALGLHAVVLQRQGKAKGALAAFRRAFAVLSKRSRQTTGSESTGRGIRLQLIHEGYMAALMQGGQMEGAAEAFRVSSVASSRDVQMALVQSAARSTIPDPALRDLVRKEQDAQKQVSALYGILSNALIEGNIGGSKANRLRTMIDDLRGARAALMEEIEQRFPEYAELINPKPAEIASIQPLLAVGEAMIVTYVGERQTHIWAIPAQGKIAFATLKEGRVALQGAVDGIRKSLAPEIETLGDIPEFDVAGAHALYKKLLAPVAAGWRGAESLLVVAHGPLGYLPFALLPTAPGRIGPQREPLFVRYGGVPWLIREHAVAMLPSAHSLAALRNLPVQSGQQRQFAGFGDPLFGGGDDARDGQGGGKETQVAALSSGTVKTRGVKTRGVKTRGVKTRGVKTRGIRKRKVTLRASPRTEGLASAGLDILPRLPETADEIRNIAVTLRADLARDVFIGAAATEGAVKATDLSAYRVVAFATHGLIPGDLDGLSQPALALSSPKMVGDREDGLLTMGEILGLKLNADWVVLSACNTGSGEGAGAEAVSGLGRAFFYAGTRALLVSNWPVETTSAMTLTTDLFRRQFEDPTLARAKALREAILALMDGAGFADPNTGEIIFSYAHPIFWAPFSLVGDGGARRSGV